MFNKYFRYGLDFDGQFFTKYDDFVINKDDIIFVKRRILFGGIIIYLNSGLKIKFDCPCEDEIQLINWINSCRKFNDDRITPLSVKEFRQFKLLCGMVEKYQKSDKEKK